MSYLSRVKRSYFWGKDLQIRGQVIRAQTQKQSFNSFFFEYDCKFEIKSYELKLKSKVLIPFFLNTIASCFDSYRQLIFFSAIHIRHVIKVSKFQKYVFQQYNAWGRKLVFICFLKWWPQTTKKKKSFELFWGRKSSCIICI